MKYGVLQYMVHLACASRAIFKLKNPNNVGPKSEFLAALICKYYMYMYNIYIIICNTLVLYWISTAVLSRVECVWPQVQAAPDWYSTAEQPGGALSPAQLPQPSELQVSLVSDLIYHHQWCHYCTSLNFTSSCLWGRVVGFSFSIVASF